MRRKDEEVKSGEIRKVAGPVARHDPDHVSGFCVVVP